MKMRLFEVLFSLGYRSNKDSNQACANVKVLTTRTNCICHTLHFEGLCFHVTRLC